MLNNSSTNCPFEDEIVSYMYDELAVAERFKFETHLSDCTVCTDEFASISEARFSVFEWQKEEFSHMPTPDIVIPYGPKRKFVDETESIGFLAGLRGWLSPLPLAAAAGIILVLGIGFLMLRTNGTGEQQIANNISMQPNDVLNAAPTKKVEPANQLGVRQPEVVVSPPKAMNKNIQPGRVIARRPVSNAKTVATTFRKQTMNSVSSTAPVLSNFQVEDDDSLRLADLFSDTDG